MKQFTVDQEDEARTELTRLQVTPPEVLCPLMGGVVCTPRCVCYVKPSLVEFKGRADSTTTTAYGVYEGGCCNAMFFGGGSDV